MANIVHTLDSYQLASGEWVPRVREYTYYSDRVIDRNLTWDEKFSTKKEADDFVKVKITEIQEERGEL